MEASVYRDWEGFARDWDFRHSVILTPFQTEHWYSTWYKTLARQDDTRPLIIGVYRGGVPVVAFPFATRREEKISVIEFADQNVTDYNAAIWAENADTDDAAIARVWGVLCRALAGEGDLLRLTKLPGNYRGRPNPLVGLPAARQIDLQANVLHVPGSWTEYQQARVRKFRKELERSWRVFLRDAIDPAFGFASSEQQAQSLLSSLARCQSDRISKKGQIYLLAQPQFAQFYKSLVTGDAVSKREVVLTALTSNRDELVAGLLGIRHEEAYAMVRLGQAGEKWKHCSPGRLIIEKTMSALHGEGVRYFDFTIGDYRYKDYFQITKQPLFEVVQPLTSRGTFVNRKEKVRKSLSGVMNSSPLIRRLISPLARAVRRTTTERE